MAGRWRHLLAAIASVALASVVALTPWLGLDGRSVDTLFLLRDSLFGPRRVAADSAVAMVLIDEATYETAPFAGLPKVLWTPEFAKVIGAISQAGAREIGFDILLSTSTGSYLPNGEAEFLAALSQAAQRHQLVMVKMRGRTKMQLPARGQLMAAGAANVRAVNVDQDPDSVVRRLPLQFDQGGGASQPTFAQDMAQRAGAPAAAAASLMLNFDGGRPFPVYALSDIYACSDADFFRRNFAGKIVLIGTGLDNEDRVLTSRRLINPVEQFNGERCTPAPLVAPTAASATVAGEMVNATAIDNLLRGEGLREPGLPVRALVVAVAGGIAAALALAAGLAAGLAGLVALLAAVTALATLLFQHAIVTPMLPALAAAVLSFALLVGYRFLVADQDKRRIRQMFSLYLAPSVIERMVSAGRLPSLGGERRDMTFFFSDIEGFTTLTETADPVVLAGVLNAYFDGVCDAIMRHGGMVIEFLGDGVQAMFGAPDIQPDHAARALAAAREVRSFSARYRSSGVPAQLGLGRTRIGIHTGAATVGNIGASQRLKYAALGDVVNSTSRLEGLNKVFLTDVCISEETRAGAADEDVRTIGNILLKGKSKPVLVHELREAGEGGSEFIAAYRHAYALLDAGSPDAVAAFARLHRDFPQDETIRFHAERSAQGSVTSWIEMQDK